MSAARWWVKLQSRYCVMAAKIIFFEADTSTIRLTLAWASGFYALSLAYHALAGTDLFTRSPYALMAKFGNEWVWVVIFGLHWMGVHWRVLDPKERVWAGLMVNCYGFLIWLYSTLCINIALGVFLPTSAMEWTLTLASAWALYRTGLRRESVTA